MNLQQNLQLKLSEFLAPSNGPAGRAERSETVSGMVLTAMSHTSPTEPVLIASPNRELSAHSMLGILTYCYAKGVYGSARIEKELRGTPGVRHVPTAKVLRRFRIVNRERVQAVLEKALRLMRRAKLSETMSQTLPGSAALAGNNSANGTSAIPGEETTLLVRGEAKEILGAATAIDTMLDD